MSAYVICGGTRATLRWRARGSAAVLADPAVTGHPLAYEIATTGENLKAILGGE